MRAALLALGILVPVIAFSPAQAGPDRALLTPVVAGPGDALKASPAPMTRKQHKLAAQVLGATKLEHLPVGFYVPLMRPGMVGRYDIAGWHH